MFGIMEDFVPEKLGKVERRYSGFGKDLYRRIEHRLPHVFRKLQYYQRINIQMEDSYAVCHNDKNSFCIQLDPLCEKIIYGMRKYRLK